MSAHGRQWKEHHVAAGYHEQEWGPPPTVESQLIGSYQSTRGVITVRLVPAGESGVAELELEWENGPKVTVLNEETALLYLAQDGAAQLEEPDEFGVL
jgi:hypothetical protein